MTILITGGAGFIGGHTVLAFIDRGEIPIVLDDLSTGNRAAVPDTDTPTVVQTNPSKIRNLRRKVDSLKVVAARDSPELPSKAARVSVLFRYVADRGKSVIVGYCRIGPLEPIERLDTQRRDLAAIGAQEYFCEKASVFGKMPELERAIEFARKGDVIAITKPYRVARSTRGVLALIERLGRKGVGLRILGTPIDTSTTTGRMILGSAPLWSLGASPLRSVLWDLSIGWWRGR